jgi:hypothetical protein
MEGLYSGFRPRNGRWSSSDGSEAVIDWELSNLTSNVGVTSSTSSVVVTLEWHLWLTLMPVRLPDALRASRVPGPPFMNAGASQLTASSASPKNVQLGVAPWMPPITQKTLVGGVCMLTVVFLGMVLLLTVWGSRARLDMVAKK